MKKTFISALILASTFSAKSQYSTIWPLTTTSNSTTAGYVGLGIKSTSTSTTLPGFNFQVHGVTDYLVNPVSPGGTTAISTTQNNTNITKAALNYGKTARIGITNLTTGLLSTDGTELRMSENSFYLANQETGGSMNILTNGAMNILSGGNFNISGGLSNIFSNSNKIYAGSSVISPSGYNYGTLNVQNIQATDNGLMVKTGAQSTYSLALYTSSNTNNAIEVYGSSTTTANFKVTGGGMVYARQYTAMLGAFPDYVFENNYKLKSLSELKYYISINKHLPNMPTAAEVAKNGAELGELNRLLVEKVEELTLYILQLEERMLEIEKQLK